MKSGIAGNLFIKMKIRPSLNHDSLFIDTIIGSWPALSLTDMDDGRIFRAIYVSRL